MRISIPANRLKAPSHWEHALKMRICYASKPLESQKSFGIRAENPPTLPAGRRVRVFRSSYRRYTSCGGTARCTSQRSKSLPGMSQGGGTWGGDPPTPKPCHFWYFLVSKMTLDPSPMSFLVPISTLNHEISIFWVRRSVLEGSQSLRSSKTMSF